MTKILDFVASHRKLLVALAGAAVLILGAVAGESSTAYTSVVSVLTALGVYGVPNA